MAGNGMSIQRRREKMIQKDELTTCDICGKQIWFSEGLIFYINGEPRLLCKNCQKKHESNIIQEEKP
jgi:hypothetical protein